MIRLILTNILLFSILVLAQQTVTLSVEDCIRIGKENSKTLKISKSKVIQSEAKLAETDANLYPSLKLTAGYTRLSDVGKPDFGPAGASIAKAFSPILDNYSTKITLSQPIFTGFRLSSTSEISEYNKLATEKEYEKDEKQLILEIRNSYWTLYRAIMLKENIQQNIKMIEAHLEDVENYKKNGLATDNEVLKVKVQLSNTKLLLIDAENAIEMSILALNSLIGLPLSTKIVLKDKPEFLSLEQYDNNANILNALNTREEIVSMKYRLEAANSAINLAKSGWYPQIFFFADYIYSNPNQRYFPQKKEFKGSWDFGITLSFDLWNWLLPKHQTIQAEMQYEQLKQSYELLKDQINLEVVQNYQNMIKMYEKIKVTQEAKEQARLNHKITSEKFKAGLISNSELIDAETSLLQADINYSLAIADYEFAKAKYLKSIGK